MILLLKLFKCLNWYIALVPGCIRSYLLAFSDLILEIELLVLQVSYLELLIHILGLFLVELIRDQSHLLLQRLKGLICLFYVDFLKLVFLQKVLVVILHGFKILIPPCKLIMEDSDDLDYLFKVLCLHGFLHSILSATLRGSIKRNIGLLSPVFALFWDLIDAR